MKTVIMSYSLTGNNEALATRIAEELKVEHIRITEPKKRTYGTIAADIVFGRTPQTEPMPQVMSAYDLIIFVAPIWMGQPAFPMRSYLKQLKKHPQKYAYVTISGGSMNNNPGLLGTLKSRTGAEAVTVVDLQIVDLLPSDPKPTTQVISAYQLTAQDVENLTKRAVTMLREKLPKEV
jgi:multimeric flavodoxin WrbA